MKKLIRQLGIKILGIFGIILSGIIGNLYYSNRRNIYGKADH